MEREKAQKAADILEYIGELTHDMIILQDFDHYEIAVIRVDGAETKIVSEIPSSCTGVEAFMRFQRDVVKELKERRDRYEKELEEL